MTEELLDRILLAMPKPSPNPNLNLKELSSLRLCYGEVEQELMEYKEEFAQLRYTQRYHSQEPQP